MLSVVVLAGVVSPAHAEEERLPIRWPERFTVTMSGSFARVGGWAHSTFEEPFERVSLQGEELSLAETDGWGAQITLGYTPIDLLRVEIGLGYHTPADRGQAAMPYFGPRAEIQRVHFSRWFAVLSLRHRFGDIAPFAGAMVGVEQALVDITEPSVLLRSYRVVAGPRLGVRAHLHQLVYVEAVGDLNLVELPEFSISAGLGIGAH